jgi:predicted O-methyltransferase YrrM
MKSILKMQIRQNLFSDRIHHLDVFAEENALGPIQRDEALFLIGIVRMIRPKTIVEFGFSWGHSALNFLQALDGKGELYSYDISDASADCAAKNFSKNKNFHFIKKPQEQFSPSDVCGQMIDFVFLDGANDKVLGQTTFKAILPSLAENAIVAIHNTGIWEREYFLPDHNQFQRKHSEGWLNSEEFQHQKEEREFVNWIAENYPEFQLIHFHSSNCIRHGITLMQRQRKLVTCSSDDKLLNRTSQSVTSLSNKSKDSDRVYSCKLNISKRLAAQKDNNTSSKRRNLVVVRAGDESLHPKWLNQADSRNFDIFVSYFGKIPGRFEEEAEYYESVKGLKWPILEVLLSQNSDLFSAYDACWFPDDDLLTDAETISQMFDLFHAHDLWLAQPALGPGSHLTYPVTTQIPHMKLRFTGFVEIMCPIFNRHALSILGPTFGSSASGWGLDFLWAHLLDYPQDRIAILDETPVIHTRPIGGGSFYVECHKMEINPKADMIRVLTQHGIQWQQNIPVYKTIQNIPAVPAS